MSTSDTLALISLIVSIAAFLVSAAVAIYTVWRSDKTSSAGALIAIEVALRDGWDKFLGATTADQQEYEFAELLNLLETCCALYDNKSFTSTPRKLLKRYLLNVFRLLAMSSIARDRLRALSQASDTFEYISKFEKCNRASLSLMEPLFIAEPS